MKTILIDIYYSYFELLNLIKEIKQICAEIFI